MTPKGFRFIDDYAVEVNNTFIDLHNDFDLVGTEVNFETKTVRMSWHRLPQGHVSRSLPSSLVLVATGADRILSVPASCSKSDGGRTISFIGFLHPDQAHVLDGCVGHLEAGDEPDFIVGFEDNSALKVFGPHGVLEAELK